MKTIRHKYYNIDLPPACLITLTDHQIFNWAVWSASGQERVYWISARWVLRSISRDTGTVHVRRDL